MRDLKISSTFAANFEKRLHHVPRAVLLYRRFRTDDREELQDSTAANGKDPEILRSVTARETDNPAGESVFRRNKNVVKRHHICLLYHIFCIFLSY